MVVLHTAGIKIKERDFGKGVENTGEMCVHLLVAWVNEGALSMVEMYFSHSAVTRY